LRQRTGSVVCPDCGRLVEVGEERCPFCGRWQPSMFGYSSKLRDTLGDLSVSKGILALCAAFYLVSLLLDPRAIFAGGGYMELLSPSMQALERMGMTGRFYVFQLGLWWTPLSATFLHGGLVHIFFNMLFLRILGPHLEEALGPSRFFLLYIASGIGGFILSVALSNTASVGASGAIFGLLGATIMVGRAQGGEWGRAISMQAIVLAAVILFMGFMSPTTDNLAHIGGFGVGGAMSGLLLPYADRSEGPAVQMLALLAGLATIGAVVASLIVTEIRFF
jgi:rhomboid protease GluP